MKRATARPWTRGGERHGVVLCCVDLCGRLHVQGAALPCHRPCARCKPSPVRDCMCGGCVRCWKWWLWGGALRPPEFVCVSHSQSPWLPPPPSLPVPHVVSLRTPVVCASSIGSCKVRVVASQLVAGDHAPPGAPAGERHGVVFICVGCCTSKAPCSPALALCPVQAVACA